MRRVKDPSLDQFEDYLEYRPSQLGCWRQGAVARYPTLAWLNTQPITETTALAAQTSLSFAAMATTARQHNQVGIAAGWTTKFMTGGTKRYNSATQDLPALLRTSAAYWSLKNALVEVRVGVRGFESKGAKIRLPYRGNNKIDALDRILDMVHQLDELEHPPPLRSARLRDWFWTEGPTRPWEQLPRWVKESLRTMARAVIDAYPRYLADNSAVGGIPINALRAYWIELMARGMQMQGAAIAGPTDTRITSPLVDRDAFVASMARECDIDLSSADAITSLLTLDLDRCPDPALTPLILMDGDILAMSSLIVVQHPERNFLAILQRDPSLVGTVGRKLGAAGELAITQLFEQRAPKLLIARRIPVLRENGEPAGDLDVVLYDPAMKLAAVFEIKWHITADGNEEVYRAMRLAEEKRKQLVRLRSEIQRGLAHIQWPRSWPNMENIPVRWYVLTHDVLPMERVDDEDIVARSYQMLSRMLKPTNSIHDITSLLDDPPTPPSELCETQWDAVRYGDIRVEVEWVIA